MVAAPVVAKVRAATGQVDPLLRRMGVLAIVVALLVPVALSLRSSGAERTAAATPGLVAPEVGAADTGVPADAAATPVEAADETSDGSVPRGRDGPELGRPGQAAEVDDQADLHQLALLASQQLGRIGGLFERPLADRPHLVDRRQVAEKQHRFEVGADLRQVAAPVGAGVEVDADLADLATHGIEPPYIAFASTIEPRKNVPKMLSVPLFTSSEMSSRQRVPSFAGVHVMTLGRTHGIKKIFQLLLQRIHHGQARALRDNVLSVAHRTVHRAGYF